LEDELVEGGVGGLELAVGGGRSAAQAFNGVEEGRAGHPDFDDIADGDADLGGA
jgi:hypothetical protein